MNLGTLFYRSVSLFPDRLAICQQGNQLTYAQLADRTNRMKALLIKKGLQKGQKVLFLMNNDYRFAECLFACMQLGIVPVPVNIKLSANVLHYVAENSEAKLILCTPDFVRLAKDLVSDPENGLLDVWTLTDDDAYEKRLANAVADRTIADVEPDTTALMMYTSGSTGKPKGCLLSHQGTLWMVKNLCHVYCIDETDSALIVGPLYHANALWCMFYPLLYVGGCLHIKSGFDAKSTLLDIHTDRPTYMSGTPAMFKLMLGEEKTIQELRLDSLNFVLVGSAPVTEKQLAAIKRCFDTEIVEGYGSTEAGVLSSLPRWGLKKLGSMGMPLLGVEHKVMHTEQLVPVPEGITGELWVKTPALLTGYHKQRETYEKKVKDGWYRTSDLVSEDTQGYLYFKGRTDDMINCGGENIYPKEVANLLLANENIVEAEIIAVPHKVKGEAPVAWVVLAENAKLDENTIKQYTLANGPAYAHPRKVFFTKEFPLNGTAKVDYQRLKELTLEQLPDGL